MQGVTLIAWEGRVFFFNQSNVFSTVTFSFNFQHLTQNTMRSLSYQDSITLKSIIFRLSCTLDNLYYDTWPRCIKSLLFEIKHKIRRKSWILHYDWLRANLLFSLMFDIEYYTDGDFWRREHHGMFLSRGLKYHFKPQDTRNIPWCSRQQSRHLLYCMAPHCLSRLLQNL